MTTDAQLIAAARNDPVAFGELYERHVRRVYAFLSTRAPQAAGELTAETFAQAALSLRRFRDEADPSALPCSTGSPAICFAAITREDGWRRERAMPGVD